MADELNYKKIDEFVDYLYKDRSDMYSITIIAKYDTTRIIIEELIRKGMRFTGASEFYDPWISGYKDEYILSITGNDTFVEPIRIDGDEYCEVYDDIIYILGDEVNSKALKTIKGGIVYLVYIDEEESIHCADERCNCETCNCKSRQESDNDGADDYDDNYVNLEDALTVLRVLSHDLTPLRFRHFGMNW